MSRGGFRGRGRGGGRGGGRTGFGGFDFSQLGTTYQEVMNESREPDRPYPRLEVMPSLAEISEQDKKASLYQHAMIDRLRQSQYHMVEESKRPDFVRYSDKFRPTPHEQLLESDLDQDFFPDELWQRYFHPKKPAPTFTNLKKKSKRLDLDALEEEEKQAGEDEDEEELEEHEEDAYEEDEEDDYNDNFFETGSQDDPNDMVGGGDDGGGGDDD